MEKATAKKSHSSQANVSQWNSSYDVYKWISLHKQNIYDDAGLDNTKRNHSGICC